MVFRNDVQAIPDTRDYPLETMRAVAVFLLVSYHVVGSARHNGLEVDYPHMLRVYADYLIDIRMPFFAFIAGYVYGLRPIKPGQYRSFVSGKFHRLYIPGCIAAALFALAATLQHSNGFARDSADFWQIFFFPYAHYWFLQAILVIFVVFGAFDALARGRYTVAVFVAAILLYMVDPFIPGNLMSVNAAVYLFPFFLFGLLFIRNTGWIEAHVPLLILASGATVVATTAWNLWGLHETGKLSLARHDLQSLAAGLSACALAMLTLPRISRLEVLGPFALTIYLYHVFATSGMRQILHEFGITGIGVNFAFGTLAGLGVPVLLHLLADRYPLTRRYMLGKRR